MNAYKGNQGHFMGTNILRSLQCFHIPSNGSFRLRLSVPDSSSLTSLRSTIANSSGWTLMDLVVLRQEKSHAMCETLLLP